MSSPADAIPSPALTRDEFQTIRAIQYRRPAAPRRYPAELSSVIFSCLQKTPAERYASAAEVREALKTIMKTSQIETGIIPGDAGRRSARLPPRRRREASHRPALHARRALSRVGDTKEKRSEHDPRSALSEFRTLPRSRRSTASRSADAIAARLARMSSLVVRPSSALMHLPIARWIRSKLATSCSWSGCSPAISSVPKKASISTGNCSKSPARACAPAAPSAFRRSISSPCRPKSATKFSPHSRGSASSTSMPRSASLRAPSRWPRNFRGVSAGPRHALVIHAAHRQPRRPRTRPRAFRTVVERDPAFAPAWSGSRHRPSAISPPWIRRPHARHGGAPRL